MSLPRYRGLTWDHPRGYGALQAASVEIASRQGLSIDWAVQPLEGFESHSIADLCSRYDLVVLDHPHIGEAVEAACLTPLEDLFGAGEIAEFEDVSIGPSLASYRYVGRVWALPLDAATQVTAFRADRLTGSPPQTWEDVAALSNTCGVALSTAGPHAILCYLSIAVAMGDPPAELDPEILIGEPVGTAALDLLRYIAKRAAPSVAEKNPIGILEHMAVHDDVVLCPLIYGYVNYTRPAADAHAIAFADAPRASREGRPGSVLGGTGIGVTKRCAITPALKAHLTWLMSDEGQRIFIPAHDGQPSRRAAWRDDAVNEAWGNFYKATSNTIEAAYVRPRHAGYIDWQTQAATYLRSAIANGTSSRAIVRKLNATYLESAKGKAR